MKLRAETSFLVRKQVKQVVPRLSLMLLTRYWGPSRSPVGR